MGYMYKVHARKSGVSLSNSLYWKEIKWHFVVGLFANAIVQNALSIDTALPAALSNEAWKKVV